MKEANEYSSAPRYEDIHFVDSTKPVWNYSLFTDDDIQNFQQGTHYRLYEIFGSRPATVLGKPGYYFAVWAPNATFISVKGNCLPGATVYSISHFLLPEHTTSNRSS